MKQKNNGVEMQKEQLGITKWITENTKIERQEDWKISVHEASEYVDPSEGHTCIKLLKLLTEFTNSVHRNVEIKIKKWGKPRTWKLGGRNSRNGMCF